MTKNLRVKTSKFIDETYKISFKFNGTTYTVVEDHSNG